MDKKIEKFEFRVIDNNTGEEADIEEIAFTEGWAEGLIYCDMEGFAVLEDGSLVLLDECGNCAYCPSGRFSIIPENAVVLPKEEYEELQKGVKTYNYTATINAMEANRWEKGYLLGCKETAEKFAVLAKERVRSKLRKGKALHTNILGKEYVQRIFREAIDEICKEITEGKNG